ncbi:MAG: hypothetical protein R3300_07865 [Candidatus Promineifilaceae bacterium]|nr:hypothetical protein [Candidatus Promineifilaceae bacterium]
MHEQQLRNLPRGQLVLAILWIVFGLVALGLAIGRSAEIQLRWQTESELDTAGFNIYRSADQDGPFRQINERLVPSVTGSAGGATYVYDDNNVEWGRSYYYRIEDIQLDGAAELHEPIRADVAQRAWWLTAVGVIAVAAGAGLTIHIFRS